MATDAPISPLNDDAYCDLLDAVGKALGFLLPMALNSGTDFGNKASITMFSDAIGSLIDSERFSPEVALIMTGVCCGLDAVASRSQQPGEIV